MVGSRRSILLLFVLLLGFAGIGPVAMAGNVLYLRSGEVKLGTMLSTFSRSASPRDYVIQFKSPIRKADHELLRSNGIKVLRYIPEDALIVRGQGKVISLALDGRLNGMAVYSPNWKMAPLSADILSANEMESFDLMAFSVQDAKRLEKQLKARKFDPTREDRMLRFHARPSQIKEIAELQGVESVEPTPVIENMMMHFDGSDTTGAGTTDTAETADIKTADTKAAANGDYTDLKGYESGTRLMGFESVWNQGFTGQGQMASMADTGLDLGVVGSLSADFNDAVNEGLTVGIGAKDWSDPMGHGTHVAGSILGRGAVSNGLIQGGAFGAEFYPVAMWSPLLDNLTVPPKLARLFDPAMQKGARVHSNSWGSPRNLGAYDGMAAQVDEFTYQNPELLVVFAAGNSGVDKNRDGVIDLGSVSSPGTAKNALTVGASENLVFNGGIQRMVSELGPAKENWSAEPIWSSRLSDNANGIACFSSRGPTLDGRLKPDIVAPGTNILSARSHAPGAQELWGAYNADYVYSGGTSMAAPLAAAAATVTREILGRKFGVRNPSGALVKAVLLNTAMDLFPGQYGLGTPAQELRNRPENNQGYGRVNMEKVGSLTQPLLVDEKKGVSVGQTKEFQIDVADGRTLVVNLVYTDPPGTPAAARALVNDLDLVVSGPAGDFSPQDRINNHEVVEVKNAAPGTYKIRVIGKNVPMGGAQSFALVASVE